jgi:hypothetical protein
MSTFTYQILKDTTEKAVIKLTGGFNSSTAESNVARIAANSLYGALNSNTVPGLLTSGGTARSYYGLSVTRLNYNVNMPIGTGYVELYWKGSTNATIAQLNQTGELGSQDLGLPSIPNNAGTPNGDIGIITYGQQANSSYTIIIELRKDNNDYQRGQFNDPAAFNYPPYSITP